MFSLDAIRAVATVLVIVIHADHWPLQNRGADRVLWSGVDLIARIALPLFVVLSGVLLTYRTQARTSEQREDSAGGGFLERRLRRSLLPWLVWGAIYTVIFLYLIPAMPQTARGVGGWWLAGGGHLYFLILIAQLYGVFLFWPRSVRGTAVAAAVALALQTALCVYRLYAPATAPLNGVFLSFGYELFFFWIGYFALGAALGARLSKGTVGWASWPFWLAVPIGAALLFFLDHSGAANASFAQGTGAFLRPVLPPVALATFVALALSADSALANWPFARRVVSVVSRYSLGVYILHEALMYVPGRLLSQPLLHRHLPVSVVGFVLLVLATLVIALAATRLLVATPMAITLGSARMPLRIRR